MRDSATAAAVEAVVEVIPQAAKNTSLLNIAGGLRTIWEESEGPLVSAE